jgi:hypothetical protein
MAPIIRLHWLRESGRDEGTAIDPGGIPPAIRDRVLALAGNDAEIALRLPFLDKREWRKRDEALAALSYQRHGAEIRAALDPAAATRDQAATLALADAVWQAAPDERDPQYGPVWQRVSVFLQRSLKEWIATEYFRDIQRLEDRGIAYPMVLYQASRPFFGGSRNDFTWDLRDYPQCLTTVAAAYKMTGRATQNVLAGLERRLKEAGRTELARRYAPDWHKDVLIAVRKKPKHFAELLAAEAAIVNAVIDLGVQKSADAVNRSARAINMELRNVQGIDMRFLGVRVLEQATRALSHAGSGSRQDLGDPGILENGDVAASGSPDAGI